MNIDRKHIEARREDESLTHQEVKGLNCPSCGSVMTKMVDNVTFSCPRQPRHMKLRVRIHYDKETKLKNPQLEEVK